MTSLDVTELFQGMWRRHFMDDFFAIIDKQDLLCNMTNMMVTVWNMTDKCDEMCQRCIDIGVHSEILAYLKDERLFTLTEAKDLRYLHTDESY